VIQAKLTVNQPGDIYEQEADRMAAQVMAMPQSGSIQREIDPKKEKEKIQMLPMAAPQSYRPIQREMEPKKEKEKIQMMPLLQRASDGNQEAGGNLENRLNSSKGGGNPLPDDVRSFMEPRFGTDFSQVRVHTGSESVQMNQDLNAQAFTHRQDVYFGAGKAPGKDALTAHELTHVVQQGQSDSLVLSDTTQSPSMTSSSELVQRNWTNPVLSLKSDKELLDAALNEGDTAALKQVTDFSSISSDLKKVLQLIDLLNNEGSVWGRDARAMRLLWSSLGASFYEVAEKDGGARWKISLSKVPSLSDDVPAAKVIKEQFENDVKTIAKNYLKKNDKTVRDEMKRLGLSETEAETAQSPTKEQADAMQNVQKLASDVADLQKARDALSQITVGRRNASSSNDQDELNCGIQHYNNQDGIDEDDQRKYEKSQKFYNEHGGGDDPIPTLKHECKVPATFDPNKQPEYPLQQGDKGQPWEKVNEVYQKLSKDIADIANQSPAVYALIAQGGQNPAAEAANASPENVRNVIAKAMREVLKNIKDTDPKIDSNDLDYRDLTPIHAQLYSGMKAESGSGIAWSEAVPQLIAKDIVKGHEATQALNTLLLQNLAAMAFLVAEVASLGTATFFIAAAVAVGAAGVEVAISAEKYEDLAKAAKTNVSDTTSIISQGQVDAAQLDLQLAAVAALLIAASLSGKIVESIQMRRNKGSIKPGENVVPIELPSRGQKSIRPRATQQQLRGMISNHQDYWTWRTTERNIAANDKIIFTGKNTPVFNNQIRKGVHVVRGLEGVAYGENAVSVKVSDFKVAEIGSNEFVLERDIPANEGVWFTQEDYNAAKGKASKE